MEKKNILIIEDESIIAFELCLKLESAGYKVIGIANCEERAVKIIESATPDLILSEIILHGATDGIEAVRRIRELIDVAVIYVTSNKYLETDSRLLQTNPCAVIGKPFKDEELFDEIKKCLLVHKSF